MSVRLSLNDSQYVLFLFLGCLLVPGLISNLGLVGSHAPGMLISSFLIAFVCLISGHWVRFNKSNFLMVLCLLLFIFLHFFAATLVTGFDKYLDSASLYRLLFSLLMLIIFLWSAFQIEWFFFNMDQTKFIKVINTVYYFLISLALAAIPFHALDWVSRKQMLFFSEPSHFALIFGQLYLYKVLVGKNVLRQVFICMMLSVLLQNATLLVFLTLGLVILGMKRDEYSIFRSWGVIFGVSLFIWYFQAYFSFLFDRIILQSNSGNLSVLMFLSGYERAYLTFFETFGLGVGFQQMGVVGPLGDYQLAIQELTGGFTMNTLDGGTLFSKLVTEFGAFGMTSIVVLLLAALVSFQKRVFVDTIHPRILFYRACLFSVLILIFVRSVGYFSPSSFVVIIAIVGLMKSQPRKRA